VSTYPHMTHDLNFHKRMIQLTDITDLYRARIAMTRLRVSTDNLPLTPEGKASRIALLTLVEQLITAEIDTLYATATRATRTE